MRFTYDVIVLGLGGMGSATCYQLARRGVRVLGLEQFTPAHNRGSSHGHSRIIRQAYFEDPAYVPLLLRSYELWRQLEAETGDTLLTVTGGLMIGPPNSEVIRGSQASATEHGLPHEMLDASEIRRWFPALTPSDDQVALFETQAGFVRPEAAIRAHLSGAKAQGADLHFEEPVRQWTATPDGGVAVTTDKATYHADRLVITAGAWAPDVLADLGLPLTVERQVLYWFAPRGGSAPFLPDHFPIYIWEMAPDLHFYGFPSDGDAASGVKVAFYRMGKDTITQRACAPDTVDRTVSDTEVARMRDALRTRIPALNAPLISATVCLYTNTPDGNFVLAPHPEHSQVIVASPCSGHGYKFCPVIGEILADMAQRGTTEHPIGLFDINRPALRSSL